MCIVMWLQLCQPPRRNYIIKIDMVVLVYKVFHQDHCTLIFQEHVFIPDYLFSLGKQYLSKQSSMASIPVIFMHNSAYNSFVPVTFALSWQL